MKYRSLNGLAEPVSELCFGTMRYARKDGVEDSRSAAGTVALEKAIERGVNFIHSSYEYETRWLTGRLLKAHRKRADMHHIIKVNVPDWEEPRFSRNSFRRQVESALIELGAERIAVVQHLQRGVSRKEIMTDTGNQHRLAQFDEVSSELAEITGELRQAGKIGTVMSFPYTVDFARLAVEADVYSGLVAYFNLLETEMVEFFPRLREQGKDFVAIRPLAGGILTEKRVDRESLPSDDRMRTSASDSMYARLEQVRSLTGKPPVPWEQYAFQFTLADPLVKSTVLGINNEVHLATAGSDYPVEPEFVHQIAEIKIDR